MKKLFYLLALLSLTGCVTHKIAVGDGLVLKSPNGTRYEITIDDNGETGTGKIK
jgi:hypothetical protein